MISVLGNLGRDPERFGTSDKAPYKFSVAVNDRKRKIDGSREAMFLEVVVFTDTPAFRTIEALAKSGHPLKKGSLVQVDGQLQQEEYEAKDKATQQSLGVRTNTIVRAFNIELPRVGRPGGNGQGQSSGSNEAATPAGAQNTGGQTPSGDAPGGTAYDI